MLSPLFFFLLRSVRPSTLRRKRRRERWERSITRRDTCYDTSTYPPPMFVGISFVCLFQTTGGWVVVSTSQTSKVHPESREVNQQSLSQRKRLLYFLQFVMSLVYVPIIPNLIQGVLFCFYVVEPYTKINLCPRNVYLSSVLLPEIGGIDHRNIFP